MRILFVTHSYPPYGVAGVERVTEQTATVLAAGGHTVSVLARRRTAAPPLPVLERGSEGPIDVRWVVGAASASAGDSYARLDRIFERVLLELCPDVVVLGHLSGHSPNYVAIAQRWAIPVVMELHDFYASCERAHLERVDGALCAGPEGGVACARHCFAGEVGGFERWHERTRRFGDALGRADAIVAPSRFVAEHFRRSHPTAEPVHVIPNGVVMEGERWRSDRREDPNRVLQLASLGVVVPHKGPHVVLEALRKAHLPSACFTLFGPVVQPYARDLHVSAEKIPGLHLRMYGSYDPWLLPFLLADIDLVIVPSTVWETFSIVVREAMSCGVPVLATRLGALPEAIREGENGFLFSSSAELAAQLEMLNANRVLISRLRSGIEPGDWISVTERARLLEDLLVELVGSSPDTGSVRSLPGKRSMPIPLRGPA